jgi:hypothetical protein
MRLEKIAPGSDQRQTPGTQKPPRRRAAASFRQKAT